MREMAEIATRAGVNPVNLPLFSRRVRRTRRLCPAIVGLLSLNFAQMQLPDPDQRCCRRLCRIPRFPYDRDLINRVRYFFAKASAPDITSKQHLGRSG